MSEHVSSSPVAGDPVTLETGLEALQSSPEFHGPVEHPDDHHCNDHFAQIYETDAERFATAVPFVRHGLERGERVIYVVEAHREPEVRAALREGGIDVEAALDSEALSFYTAEETYLRNDSFEPEEMVEFYGDTVAAATEEFEALRIVAETSWLDPEAIPYEQFMEYEAKVNRLFDAENCLALCQYDRRGFPDAFIRNIVESHPHLIYDGAACHNVYYTPPAEIFDDDPTRELNRMLRTLRERTEAKAELQTHERFLQDLHAITADQSKSFEEKLHALLELGRERFGLDLGALNRVDPDADRLTVEYTAGDHTHFEPGVELPLSETYCRAAADIKAAATVSDPADEGFDDLPVYEEFGVEGYIGTYIPVAGDTDRTLAFVPDESRSVSITEQERASLELMGQWIGYELNRRQRERFLRESYEVTADPERSFEEKVEYLLEYGRDWFDLDMAGLHHLPSWDSKFRLEQSVGLDVEPDDEPLITDPGGGAYCRQAVASDEPVGMADVRGTDWEDDRIYQRLGVTSYLGTTVSGGGTPYGTLWFGSTDPRDEPFSEVERTFIDLMGQWIGYELERRQRERFLRESHEITADPDLEFEEKLEQLLDLGREWMGVNMAGLTHLPEEDDKFLNEYAIGYDATDGGVVTATDDMWTDPGNGSYCRQAIESDDPVGMADVRGTDWEDDPVHQDHGLSCYLGTKVTDGAMPYGTLWVGDTEPRDREFSETERTFLELMAQWVSYELERREHNDAQRELYEVTADTDLDTPGKIARLLELGCDHLDLPVGMLNHDREETIRVEQMHGDHPDVDADAVLPPSSEHYCRQAIDTKSPVTVADAAAAGWDGDPLYEEVGLETYAGVPVLVGGDVYGTICFTDLSPRDGGFTEAEQTFLELMGQCVSYELDRTHREEQLKQKNDRLESFASMLAHELRNPVAIGQIYSQQLPDEADTEAVEYVTEAFDRIENMVDVMLVLTRGQEAVEECTPVDVEPTVRDVWDDIDASDAVLEVSAGHTIHADETYIRHLFRNLLENAVEHGGSDVTIEVGDLDDTDGFYVADDGPGISPEDQDTIFDEGYTTAADRGGTGLGLAFVQKLIEVYEWDCCITESEAGGARFEFRTVR